MTFDILLVNAHRDHFGSSKEAIGMGTNVLTRYLQTQGFEAAMFLGAAHGAWDWLETTMRERGARCVGFYCDYENVSLVAEFSRRIKEGWAVPVVVGGPQTVGLGKDFFTESGCNVLVHGEAEYTLRDLLNSLLHGTGDISDINGITLLAADGNLIQRPAKNVLGDLDALPWPDYHNGKGAGPRPTCLPIMTGRGCPYRCAFCYEGSNSQKVRYRSVENVMAEIEANFQWNPDWKYIFFLDDTFTLSPKRVDQICKGLKHLRGERDFVWFCEGHIQTLYKWPEMLEQMADAGLAKLFLGLESGSDEVLRLYNKQTTTDMVETVVREAVKAGIPHVTGTIIVGGPIESAKTIQMDIDFVQRLLRCAPGRFDTFGFHLMPYPNTPITLHPENFGLKILQQREFQCLEDIPLSETDSIDWAGMFNARTELNRTILQTMVDLYEAGGVPHSTILKSYQLASHYGVYSRWYLDVYTRSHITDRYYKLLSQNAIARSTEISAADLQAWRPRRVFEIWNAVSFDRGFFEIQGYVLSPLEIELLLLSSGKLRLSEVLDRSYTRFQQRHASRGEFDKLAQELLQNYEQMKWIGYSRF